MSTGAPSSFFEWVDGRHMGKGADSDISRKAQMEWRAGRQGAINILDAGANKVLKGWPLRRVEYQ